MDKDHEPKNNNAPIYRALAYAFLGIAGVFVGLEVLERFLGVSLLRGNPLPTALFVGLIGAALLFTSKQMEN